MVSTQTNNNGGWECLGVQERQGQFFSLVPQRKQCCLAVGPEKAEGRVAFELELGGADWTVMAVRNYRW